MEGITTNYFLKPVGMRLGKSSWKYVGPRQKIGSWDLVLGWRNQLDHNLW